MATNSRRLTLLTFLIPVAAVCVLLTGSMVWFSGGLLMSQAEHQSDWMAERVIDAIGQERSLWSLEAGNTQSGNADTMSRREAFLTDLLRNTPAVKHVSVINHFDQPLVESGIQQHTSWFSTYSLKDRGEILLAKAPSNRQSGNERFYPLTDESGNSKGVLRVGLDRQWRSGQMAGMGRMILLADAVGLGLCMICALWYFRHRYIRPLSTLIYAVDRHLDGEISRRVDLTAVEQDTAELAVTLNTLFEQIEKDRHTIAQLQDQTEDGEKRLRRVQEDWLDRTHEQARSSQSWNERFNILRQMTSDGVLVLDEESQVVDANSAGRRILGLHVGQQGIPRDLRESVRKVLSTKGITCERVDIEAQTESAVLPYRADVFAVQGETVGKRCALVVLKRRDQETAGILPTGTFLAEILRTGLEPSLLSIMRRLEQGWPDLIAGKRLDRNELQTLEGACRGARSACEKLTALAEVSNLSSEAPSQGNELVTLIEALAEETERDFARPNTLFHLRMGATVSERYVDAPGLSLALRILFRSARSLGNKERLSVEAFASGTSTVIRMSPNSADAEESLLKSNDIWSHGVHAMKRQLAERITAGFGGKLLFDRGTIEVTVPTWSPVSRPSAENAEVRKVDQMVQTFLRGA